MKLKAAKLLTGDESRMDKMFRIEVDALYRTLFKKKKQFAMEDLLEKNTDELFQILIELKTKTQITTDPNLEPLQ